MRSAEVTSMPGPSARRPPLERTQAAALRSTPAAEDQPAKAMPARSLRCA